MADNPEAAEIALLGRLCGIAPEFCDNLGGRHPTPLATTQALLSAMAIPWREPARRRAEVRRRLLGPWGRFLEPVQVLLPGSQYKINLHFLAPSADLPSSIKVWAQLSADSGQRVEWQEDLPAPAVLGCRAVLGGFRHRLELLLPAELTSGYHDLALRLEAGGLGESGRTRLLVAPDRSYFPDCLAQGRRLWGFNLPLYALGSARNWGIGDFRDLTELIDWAARLGASFVGINPLHAPPALADADPSPYAPSSRLFRNFLYLNLEQAPEVEFCPVVQDLLANSEFQAHLARLRQGSLVPYPQVWEVKRRVLELLFQVFRDRHGGPETPLTHRGQEFAAFLRQGGETLRNFGVFGALTDHHQEGDWRRWPKKYHHPGAAAVADFARLRQPQVGLHQYAQYLSAEQLQGVGESARRLGLAFSLYQDLALGAQAGGFDTWAHPHLFAQGAAIGAPPDAFNPKGQNWGLPPLFPQALRESGHQFFIDTLRANLPADGMLRLDHVMGLFRLLWIPAGAEPAQGAYVYYPARELLAVLAIESLRRRALIIGEDLGTVTPRVRRELGRLGVFSQRVFYFERDSAGAFLPPEAYPAQAMTAVTTHDLPTLTGFWQGRDLAFKRQAKLYPAASFAEAEAAARRQDLVKLLEALKSQELLPAGAELPAGPAAPCPEPVREGVLEYLARSPAALLEVRLEEVFGWPAQQNFPGTGEEHPNWRGRLPATLEQMAGDPAPARLAVRLNRYRGRKFSK